MVAPATTYATLARQSSSVGPLTALRRPLVAALAIGVSMSISTTGHVTPALVFNTTAAWAFVIVLQIAIALPLIAGPSRRSVGVPRALDLFFVSHAPWSFWLITVAALPAPRGRPLTALLLLLGFVPLLMTTRAVAAFFREVLHFPPWRAAAYTVLHQAITWTTFVVLYGTAVALPPRVAGWLGS